MAGAKHHGLHGNGPGALQAQLIALGPTRVILAAAAVAAIVTIVSIAQLHALVDADDTNFQDLRRSLHTDLKIVAERALVHAEHLPQFHVHGHAVGGGSDIGGGIVGGAAALQLQQTETPPVPASCGMLPHAEMWGNAVKWGANHKVTSAAACCKACQEFRPGRPDDPECNVWVWCGDRDKCGAQYLECWLKHLAHPQATKPVRQGPDVGWTSGIKEAPAPAEPVLQDPPGSRRFHIITSAQGTAVHWQSRVHYYWYKRRKAECEAGLGCEMGGFTRLLHSGRADDLMDEIPTFLADPLPDDVVPHQWYPVLNRPYAFLQWVRKARIPERYVLMAEPDHIFLRPLPNLMRGSTPAAYPFFYIEPSKEDNLPHVARLLGMPQLTRRDAEAIAPIGNSPTFLTWDQMQLVVPVWYNLSIETFKDQPANQKWGWVQEMYAFTMALFKVGIKQVDLLQHMMAQPPWDANMEHSPGKPYHILHYTYGCDFDANGTFTPGKHGYWRFDKRTYGSKPPPRHLGDPPRGMANDMVRALISSINNATNDIPCWDLYAQVGHKVPCTSTLPGDAAARSALPVDL